MAGRFMVDAMILIHFVRLFANSSSIFILLLKGSSKDDLAAAFNMRSDGIVLAKELHELSAQYKAS
jgi:hypothetical protein